MASTSMTQPSTISRFSFQNFFTGTFSGTKAETESQKVFSFSFQERLWYLRQYGNHCMAFSVLQPNMKYFDLNGIGFVAYMEKWGARFVLSDPICDDKYREKLLNAFLSAHDNVSFIQISDAVARYLNREHDYYATQLGIETKVDLTTWDMKGKKKQVLRTAVNQARKKGVVIRENDHEDRDEEITQRWLRTRKVNKRELIFLIRPMKLDYEKGTRKFYAYQDDQLIGFIYFDPIYEGGKVVSYVPNISRFSQDFSQGIFYALMVHAFETFKKEGLHEVDLGLSPLVMDDKDETYEAKLFKQFMRLTYRYGNSFYNFKGINFTKSRFRGESRKVFNAHKSSLPLWKFTTIFKMAHVI